MAKDIRFCTTSDGVNIAYATEGDVTLKGFDAPVTLHTVRP